MSSPFVAEICAFAFNFAPTGWAQCNGQLLPISQNTALFSLLGTSYGGDGRSTFALPNLQDAVPVHVGGDGRSNAGPGLQQWNIGQAQGSATVTLLQSEIPNHTHALQAANANATSADPTGNVLGKGYYNAGAQKGAIAMYQTAAADTPMHPLAAQTAGGGLPHNNMMPFCVMNYCIAMQGVFPPRG